MKLPLLFCLFSTLSYAQNLQELDSLKRVLNNTAEPVAHFEAAYKIADSYRRSQLDSAQRYLNFVLLDAQNSNDTRLKARAWQLEGVVLRDLSAYEKSIEVSQKALNLYETLGDKKGMGKTLSAIGLTYKKMGDAQKVTALTQKALEYGEKAIETLLSVNDSLSLPSAYNNLGITYRDLKMYDAAEKAYKSGSAIQEKRRTVEAADGVLYANLGQLYMDSHKNYTAVILQLNKALAIHEKFGNQQGAEHTYRNLSEAYRRQNNYSQALLYAEKSVSIASKFNDLHRSFNAYMMLYKAQEASELYKDALGSLKIAKTLEDSTVRLAKTQSIAEMESKYETAKKELEIERLNDKNRLQRQQLMVGGLALLVLLGLLGALFFQNKKIKQSQQQIAEQAEQLRLMMRELHHRVKNNLAIVSSLLKIQSNKIEDEKAVQAVRQGQQRVEAMALIHQRLYQTDKIAHINIKEYITDLVESLMHAYGYAPDNFDLHLNIEQELLDVDTAMPLGLIVNELLTNSFKYAYENIENPSLRIALKMDNNLQLDVQDNGKGIDLERWQKAKESFGKKLIAGLSKQIGGEFSVENKNGTHFKLVIPSEKLKLAA